MNIRIIYSILTYYAFLTATTCIFSATAHQKTAVFIIGTGRCGSSCTAGFLQIMGLDLGDNLRGKTHYNKKGCFEDIGTINLTNQMMHSFNARFLNPRFIDWNVHPQREKYKQQIKNYLQEHFGHSSLFGIKNGIISLFLPLYCEAAQELGFNPKIIVVERDKEAIINSWIKSNFLRNRQQAERAVSTYLQAIDIYTVAYADVTLRIQFNDLIENPERMAHTFCSFIPDLKPYANVYDKITQFIDIQLKHF